MKNGCGTLAPVGDDAVGDDAGGDDGGGGRLAGQLNIMTTSTPRVNSERVVSGS